MFLQLSVFPEAAQNFINKDIGMISYNIFSDFTRSW